MERRGWDDDGNGEDDECGGCEIESDDHVIVCVEAAGESEAEDEDEDEATAMSSEAGEGFEAEEEDASPSPCQVLDGHFDALTALANEGRTNQKHESSSRGPIQKQQFWLENWLEITF